MIHSCTNLLGKSKICHKSSLFSFYVIYRGFGGRNAWLETSEVWSKFCNDCWTFLASMLYVAMQRLDFSWIPMYFYVKKTYSWDFLFIYTIRASICSDLVISFSFLIFLDFFVFFKDVSILYQPRLSYNPRHGRCTPEKPRAISGLIHAMRALSDNFVYA